MGPKIRSTGLRHYCLLPFYFRKLVLSLLDIPMSRLLLHPPVMCAIKNVRPASLPHKRPSTKSFSNGCGQMPNFSQSQALTASLKSTHSDGAKDPSLSSPKYRNIDRPVLLRVKNQTHSLTFENPLSTIEWIQTCQEGVPSNSTATSNTISALSHLAAPALGLFCRLHSSRPWRERNLLITTAYAKLCGSCS